MIEDGLAAFASGFEYCEISQFGSIMQPINVTSNFGFLILFFWSWYKIGLNKVTFSALFIFLGSSVWHSTLHPMGLVLDIIPILLWVIFYLWAVTQYRFLPSERWLIMLLLIILSIIVTKFTATFIPMRSGIFVMGSIFLLAASYIIYRHNRYYSYLLATSCLLLTIAIIARLADISLCDTTRIGTHWLWHLLSAFSLVPLIQILAVEKNKT